MKNVTDKQKRGFADSLYHLLMTSPETGRRLGFYQVGNAPNGNLRIGLGTPDGHEFWILDVTFTESTEFEVKSIKSQRIADESADGQPDCQEENVQVEGPADNATPQHQKGN